MVVLEEVDVREPAVQDVPRAVNVLDLVAIQVLEQRDRQCQRPEGGGEERVAGAGDAIVPCHAAPCASFAAAAMLRRPFACGFHE